MIAEILTSSYDVSGKRVFRPDTRRYSGFRPTFPIGRFLSQPLKHPCANFDEMRRFLSRCTYVSDREKFGEEDYWQSPDLFEESRKGDCDDFALWAWRQLLQMNLDARFVVGLASRYGEGHAWVTFEKDGKQYLFEPLSWVVGLKLPQLSIIRYEPKFSVAWDGLKVTYFEHEKKKFHAPVLQIASLCAEWLFFWVNFVFFFSFKLTRGIARKLTSTKS